jgi:hypothetical protein
MRIYLFILAMLALLSWGCNSASQQSTQGRNAAQASLVPPDQPECSGDQSAVLIDQLDNMRAEMAGTFPYVYQGSGRSNLFEAYSMRFQLCYDELLQPLTNDKVHWIKPDAYSDKNGNFITYLRVGRDVSLSSPYISVQYIAKSLPGCSTVDSMYMFWDGRYLKDSSNQVMMPMQTVETAAGRTAVCKEYSIKPAFVKVAAKRIAYAYIDYNEEYFIGLALTTTAPNDWEMNRPLFYKMVRSFNYF